MLTEFLQNENFQKLRLFSQLKALTEASLTVSCRTKRTFVFPGFIKIIQGFGAQSSQWFKRWRYRN